MGSEEDFHKAGMQEQVALTKWIITDFMPWKENHYGVKEKILRL